MAHFKPKQVWKGREREKTKIIITISSYPTRNREFEKTRKEIQKIIKHHKGSSSSQNRLGKAEKERK